MDVGSSGRPGGLGTADRIRELLSKIRDAEQRLARLRLELRRLVAGEVGRSINERICETTSMVSSDEVTPIR